MTSSSKRPTCKHCQRPQTNCICTWIAPVAHSVEILILQHPLEVANAKGSARLLHLSLPHSSLVVAETFAEQALQALLAGKNNLLLYPDTPAEPALGIPAAPAVDPAWLLRPADLRLVVLDGTWRKSRKMLYLNPLLQRLPRLVLRNTPPSHYLIRKAQAEDQLSTLEATCYALMQLEDERPRFQPLMAAFDGFVAQQLRYILASTQVRANASSGAQLDLS